MMGAKTNVELGRVRRIIPDQVVLTEERLDALAEKFTFFRVGEFLGVSFEQFLSDPDYYLHKTRTVIRKILDVSGPPRCAVLDCERAFCGAWIGYAAARIAHA